MKIGLQLYNLRQHLNTEEDVYETLRRVREIGYKVVQISGLKDFRDSNIIQAITNACSEYSLEICATHINTTLLEDNFDYIVWLHKLWNCKYVGLGAIDKQYRDKPSIEGYMEYASKIETYAKRLESHGLHLVYHNHEFEFMKIGQQRLIDVLIQNTKITQFELDTHWIQRGGMDPTKLIYSLNGRVDILHLKDYAIYHDGSGLRSEIRYAEIGCGNLDFKEIIEAAKRCDCKYMLVEQDEFYGQDSFECAKISYQNLVAMGYEEYLK